MLARDLCIVSNEREEHFLAVREKKNAKSCIVPTLWASKVEGTKLNITPLLWAESNQILFSRCVFPISTSVPSYDIVGAKL